MLVALSQDNIGLTHNVLGDSDSELAVAFRLQISPDGAIDGDEGGVDIIHLHVAFASLKSDHRSTHDGLTARCGGKRREGLDRQLSVALGAGSDESRGNSVDLVEVERDFKWLERNFSQQCAEVGAMAALNAQDASSGSEVLVVGDLGRSAGVRANTDTF